MHRKTRAVLVPGLHQNSRLHRSSQENRSLRSALAHLLLLSLFIVVRRTVKRQHLPLTVHPDADICFEKAAEIRWYSNHRKVTEII